MTMKYYKNIVLRFLSISIKNYMNELSFLFLNMNIVNIVIVNVVVNV